MSNLPVGENSGHWQAVQLPVVGSSTLVLAGVPSQPLKGGLYRFHCVADSNIGIVDPLNNNPATVADVTLTAGVDEYYYIPNKSVISATTEVKITLAP